MAKYETVLDALSANDLGVAQEMLLAEIKSDVKNKYSWDSPHYSIDPEVQKSIELNFDNDSLITYFGLENLRDRYFLRDEDEKNIVEEPQTFFARVAAGLARGDKDFAQKLYDVMSKCWLMPGTPILTNAGNKRGLPISCFLNTVPDTLEGIFDIYRENAFLSKYAGGIGTDWSQLRGQNAPLKSTGLKSSGVIPFLKIMDSETIAISRNGLRRGAAAAYLTIDHPDIEEFIEMRKPSGDVNRQCLNLNNGIVVTDEFMKAVEEKRTYKLIDPHYKTVTKELDALEMWRKILKLRAETGEPYLVFIDTVNKALPEHLKKLGLKVRQSNLCVEIVLPTNEERTAVCCLASLNLEKYDEWKDHIEELTYLGVKALDNNLENFVDMADPTEFKKALFSVKHSRDIGLGVMGYNGYLMKNNIPFESIVARNWNKQVFKDINKYAMAASEKLGKVLGLPLDGGTKRNSHVMAIAPTASIGYICNESTPGIEPITGNAYLQKTMGGSFLVKNKHLEALLEKKGKNTQEVWKNIIAAKGSVQHIGFLSNEEKAVFRTAYEMNMREIIEQAAHRQPYVDQAMSLNVFFSAPISGKYLSEVHMMAWRMGVKTLYYVRSSAPIEATKIEKSSDIEFVMPPDRDLINEECAVCQ